MSNIACGLDFGTSNTTLGVNGDLLPLEAGAVTLPSAVFWEVDGAPPRFGRAAIAAYLEGEEGRLLRGLKSTLGSGLIQERTRIGNRAVSFREVLGRFMAHAKTQAEAAYGQPFQSVVLGRPVHFIDDDPEGDRQAQNVLAEIAREIGFADIGFQYEPIAAALDYETRLTDDELVLIVDVGGGTSDFSIVRVGPLRAQKPDRAADILANDGIRLGGTDFDRAFSLAEVMPELGYLAPTKGGQGTMPRHYYHDLATWHRINMLYTDRVLSDMKALSYEIDTPEKLARMIHVLQNAQGHGLALEVERAKIALSETEAIRLLLKPLTNGPNPMVTQPRLETALAPLMERLRLRIDTVLDQAGLTADQISTVFLTGGSSALPLLGRVVASRFATAKLARGDDLASVGTGLSLDAARRYR